MNRILAVILFFLSAVVFAQQPTISTAILADTIWIGDQTQYQITIDKDVAQQISLPQFDKGKMTEQIEVLGMPSVDTLQSNGRRVKVRVNYTITSFDAGTFILQGFPVVVGKDTIKTETVNELVVKTFPIDTTKQQLFDIKEPLDTPLVFAEIKDYVLWGAVGAVVLAAIIFLIIKLLKRRKALVAAKPKEPAHVIAIRELVLLENKKLGQAGRVKEYYSALSDIMRTYLENRYNIGAMEMTTPDILSSIEPLNDARQYQVMKEFFTLADLTKFAKWSATADQCQQSHSAMYNYVEQTKITETTNEA